MQLTSRTVPTQSSEMAAGGTWQEHQDPHSLPVPGADRTHHSHTSVGDTRARICLPPPAHMVPGDQSRVRVPSAPLTTPFRTRERGLPPCAATAPDQGPWNLTFLVVPCPSGAM